MVVQVLLQRTHPGVPDFLFQNHVLVFVDV